jgi:IS5 family transposase
MGEVDRLTGEVAGIARQSLQEVQAVARNARWWPGPPAGRWAAGSAVGELEETIAATQRLLSQTDQRLAGNRVIPDRLVSLSDPMPARSARASRERRPSSATPCCWPRRSAALSPTISSTRATRPDAPQLVPAVQRVIGVTGRSPDTVVGDRGFGTGANDQALEALGVKRVGLQRTGTPGKARLALERTRRFRRLRNWRVGIEARISHLKRSFGLRRTRLRRLGGARTWVGLGIFAYNLQRMTVVAS